MITSTQCECKECGRDFETIETLFRHMRSHKMTGKEYILKWDHGGTVPLCACGCGRNTSWNVGMRKYTTFIHGHHATGRIKSEDEKRRIGEKNRKNMTEYLKNHRDYALGKVKLMNAVNQTEESRRKRKESVCRSYASMSPEDKQKFSDHAKELWQDGTLVEARSKAAETFKERFASGVYDFTERNDRISAAITQKYLGGGLEWSTGQYTSTKTSVLCNYRSSWELELMQILDRHPEVEYWKYEPISIPYELEGKTKRYIPDFHVVTSSGKDVLIEVKPDNLRESKMNCEKRNAAIQFCERNGWTYLEWQSGENISFN